MVMSIIETFKRFNDHQLEFLNSEASLYEHLTFSLDTDIGAALLGTDSDHAKECRDYYNDIIALTLNLLYSARFVQRRDKFYVFTHLNELFPTFIGHLYRTGRADAAMTLRLRQRNLQKVTKSLIRGLVIENHINVIKSFKRDQGLGKYLFVPADLVGIVSTSKDTVDETATKSDSKTEKQQQKNCKEKDKKVPDMPKPPQDPIHPTRYY